MVPVNLRKIFPSDSMLNFFGYIEPGYQFGEEKDSFEDVLETVKIYFRENLSKEHMAGRMNELIAIEKHKILKWAPLELKNRCIRAGAKMAEQEVTAVLSNMSVVKMPEDYADYIENSECIPVRTGQNYVSVLLRIHFHSVLHQDMTVQISSGIFTGY